MSALIYGTPLTTLCEIIDCDSDYKKIKTFSILWLKSFNNFLQLREYNLKTLHWQQLIDNTLTYEYTTVEQCNTWHINNKKEKDMAILDKMKNLQLEVEVQLEFNYMTNECLCNATHTHAHIAT